MTRSYVRRLSLSRLSPHLPETMRQPKVEALMRAISSKGQQRTVDVVKVGKGYLIQDGRHRVVAMKQLDCRTVLARIWIPG